MSARAPDRCNPDHPRSRGEYPFNSSDQPRTLGSSPLSRGIRVISDDNLANSGIIPALAGNTHPHGRIGQRPADHPRSRGEYYTDYGVWENDQGSSPLSRGIQAPLRPHPATDRIIPALAGNTSGRSSNPGTSPDHPRSRGEYGLLEPAARLEEGSSPLSRGIRWGSVGVAGLLGIIPALAGNTAARRAVRTRSEDHPRSRGEYSGLWSQWASVDGSSPLSRGIRGTPTG